MKFLVLIQARMGSSRLSGKVMKNIAGKPDIQWVLERVSRSKKIDAIMLVTSVEKNNIPLVHFVTGLGYPVFVGSEDDVLDRYYQAAKLIKPEYVVRVTADCPLFDWRYLDMAIDQMNSNTDYMGEMTESFPDGLDIEIIKYAALKEAWQKADLQSEREHVTQYIKKHPEIYCLQNLECPISGIGSERWTLDEDEDFQLIDKVYRHFLSIGEEDFVTEDILGFLDENPQIRELNSQYRRNEGLLKSVANDRIVEHD